MPNRTALVSVSPAAPICLLRMRCGNHFCFCAVLSSTARLNINRLSLQQLRLC